MNLQNKKKLIDLENIFKVAGGKDVGRGDRKSVV